ncbi:hypothetical protein [Sphaerisporangium sp. TRM90804]|nr:hypothetical protein [Sphaerisporangium sp. TRM90804]MDH2428380.1 hypothetical protein [Sphaerisporangium sp. TRM90804]
MELGGDLMGDAAADTQVFRVTAGAALTYFFAAYKDRFGLASGRP